jgi:1-deoxy-D-xylulose-5-phosphate reductoisomerase
MKKKIVILGSTGSIGKITFNIIKKNKKNFEVVLLTTNKNINEIMKQVKIFSVKNLIINDKKKYLIIKNKLKNKKINIFNNFESINVIFKKKIDYCMCAISGLDGLKSTLDMIKFSKTIAIANKESLICGWDLINKELKINKTKFIPVDSEHFSIRSLLKGMNKFNVQKIIITASGGPFLNMPIKKFKKITPKLAIKHPNWNMGNKISIDSATLMNKVFEIIEAQKIFNFDINKFEILIHPKSYVHAIIKFYNGLTKILIHDTDMRIPILNSIYDEKNINSKSKQLNVDLLNNLNFSNVDTKKFPSIKILSLIPKKNTLYETIIISANDQLVHLFLKRKIKFLDIVKKLSYFIKLKEFNKYKSISPKNFDQINSLNNYVRLKVNSLCI